MSQKDLNEKEPLQDSQNLSKLNEIEQNHFTSLFKMLLLFTLFYKQ